MRHLFFHRRKRQPIPGILLLPLGIWQLLLIGILNDDIDFIWVWFIVCRTTILPLRLSSDTTQVSTGPSQQYVDTLRMP